MKGGIPLDQVHKWRINISNRLTRLHVFHQLEDKVETLLSHDSVVTFKGNSGVHILNDFWNARPSRIASSTERLPNKIRSINYVLGVNRLHS